MPLPSDHPGAGLAPPLGATGLIPNISSAPAAFASVVESSETKAADQSLAGLARWRPARSATGRWSGSAWLFVRDTEAVALAPGGTLGGSQTGGRLLYRLGQGDIALSLRAYAPLSDADAAEVAAGVDWRPSSVIPVHLLLERRQAVGGEGRSAFSITAYGGVSDARLGPMRVDAYGQAGMAGARSRDLFADGSVRIGLPIGRVKAGAGLWAAAQPGVARVDVGPQVSLAVPVGEADIVIAADWRLRAAGDAPPGSGPTLTIATEF